jgi:hypothetical protein
MSLLSERSLFVSHRRLIVDLALFAFAAVTPRLFTIFLVLACPRYCRQLNISRRALLRRLRKQRYCWSNSNSEFTEACLITVQPHMRERTMIKLFGSRIKHSYILSGEGHTLFTEHNIPLQHMPYDWLAVWLLIFSRYESRRLFVLSGLSDVWFMPLKAHIYKFHIAFDSYDPMNEYHSGWVLRALNFLNYRLGKNYIVRDARFKDALRKSGNWNAKICYLPDAAQLDVMDSAAIVRKFKSLDKIKFVSAGWVTSEGDGGILRSFQLIRSLWPNAEIHLCLTRFMRPEAPLFAPLVAYMNANAGCYVHYNLQGKAYQAMLDEAHVGLNIHDPNVFGENYKEFSTSMVRRSPSARTLDFAARGCVLMTNNENRYSQHVFKLHSPHKAVIHLTSKTKPEELTLLFDSIPTRLQ